MIEIKVDLENKKVTTQIKGDGTTVMTELGWISNLLLEIVHKITLAPKGAAHGILSELAKRVSEDFCNSEKTTIDLGVLKRAGFMKRKDGDNE